MSEIIIRTPANLGRLCPKCLGSGKVRAMQAARYIGGPAVRVKDTAVPCDRCGGFGYLKEGGRHHE